MRKEENIMKKATALTLVLLMALALFAGCGAPAENSASPSSSAAQESQSAAKDSYTVAIAQYAQHGSLDNCREGFIDGLKQAGFEEGKNLTIEYKNAQADGGLNNQIASALAGTNPDLICAIATPMAQACYNAAGKANIPVIYTAVNDPVAAMLAGEDKMPTGNVTGTSDKLPVEEQLKTIRAILPEAKTIGILYTTSEVNSESCIAEYQALAPEYGFEIVTSGVNSTTEIPMAVDVLLPKVDCLSNLTDNTVVSSLALILDKANAQNIPVFGSEIEQVKLGCVAAEGLDYFKLGQQTGAMAAKVLKRETTADQMAYEVIEGSSLYVNSEAMAKLGLTLPESLKDRAQEASA